MKVTERRTVISRISNVGEESDPEEFKKIEKQFYNIGIAIKSSSDTIRPMGEILSQLGERWKTLNDVERQNIAQASAGMYRRNAFISLMSNYDEVLKNTTAAEESEGVTAQKQAIYNDSLAASVNRLTAAWEKFYLNAINTDKWKMLVQVLTFTVNGFANFASVVGGIPATLSTVVVAVSLVSEKFRNFMSGFLGINTIRNFITSIKSAQVAMLAMNGTNMSLLSIAWARASAAVTVFKLEVISAYEAQIALGGSGIFNKLIAGYRALATAATLSGVAAKAAGLAMSIGLGIATLGLSVVLTSVIGKVMEFADSWIHAKEKQKEAFDELTKSISTLKQETSQASDLISTYEQLSQVTLKTTEQKQQYLDVTQKLAQLMPETVSGYDAEGNAILSNTNLLKELNAQKQEELKNKQAQLADSFITTGSSNFTQIQKNEKDLQNLLQKRADLLLKIKDINEKGTDNSVTGNYGVATLDSYNKQLKSLDENINKLQPDNQKLITDFVDMAFAFSQSDDTLKNLDKGTLYQFSVSLAKSGTNIKDFYNNLILLGKSGITDEIKNEQKAIDDMGKSGSTTKDIQNKLNDDINNKFIPALKAVGMNAEDARVFLEKVFDIPKVDDAINKIEKVAMSTDEFSKELSNMQSTLSEVSSAMSEYNKEGEFSQSTILNLIEKHPELIDQLKIEDGQLKLTSIAVQSLADTEINSLITRLESQKNFTSAQAIETKIRIQNLMLEAQAYDAVVNARRSATIELLKGMSSTGNIDNWVFGGSNPYSSEVAKLQAQLDADAGIESKIGVLKALEGQVNSGGLNPAPKEKKSPSTTAQENTAFKDAEDAIIAIVNAKAKLTEQNNKLIQSQTDESKNLKDYNDVLTHTKELIVGQQQQVKDLQNANSQLHWEYNHQAELGGFDTSKWFNSDGEQSLDFVRQYNEVDSATQKKMEATYTTLQKLKKAWQSNDDQIITLTANTTKLSSTLPQIQFDIVTAKIQTFTDTIAESNTQLDLSKARMALTTEGSAEYGKELVNQTQIYEQLIQTQKDSITYMQQELQDTNLSTDAKSQLTKQIQEATKAELGYQLAIQQTAQSLATEVVNGEKALAQAQLDSQEQALEASKAAHQTTIDNLQAQIDLLNTQNDATQESIDRNQKLLDIGKASLDLQKAQEALTNALNEKNTRIYVAGQGWTWQSNPNDVKTAQDNVQTANDNLAKMQTDYNQWEEDTALKHQKQLLEDQIKYEQDQMQSEQDAYDKLKNQFDKQWKDINTLSNNLLKTFNGNIDNAIDSLTVKLAKINEKLAEIANANANLANAVAGSDSSNSPSNNSNNSSSNSSPSSSSGSSSNNSIVSGISSVASVVSSIGHMLGFADGTENVPSDGLYKTGEKGPELTYLNKGSAVIPADFTKNILAFGANPLNYMQNILSNISLPKIPSFSPAGGMGGNMDNSITIQNMNVTTPNAKDFMNQMNNLRFMTNNQYR